MDRVSMDVHIIEGRETTLLFDDREFTEENDEWNAELDLPVDKTFRFVLEAYDEGSETPVLQSIHEQTITAEAADAEDTAVSVEIPLLPPTGETVAFSGGVPAVTILGQESFVAGSESSITFVFENVTEELSYNILRAEVGGIFSTLSGVVSPGVVLEDGTVPPVSVTIDYEASLVPGTYNHQLVFHSADRSISVTNPFSTVIITQHVRTGLVLQFPPVISGFQAEHVSSDTVLWGATVRSNVAAEELSFLWELSVFSESPEGFDPRLQDATQPTVTLLDHYPGFAGVLQLTVTDSDGLQVTRSLNLGSH